MGSVSDPTAAGLLVISYASAYRWLSSIPGLSWTHLPINRWSLNLISVRAKIPTHDHDYKPLGTSSHLQSCTLAVGGGRNVHILIRPQEGAAGVPTLEPEKQPTGGA